MRKKKRDKKPSLLRSFEEKSRNIRRAARKFFLSNYSIASQEARNEQQIPIQRDRSLQRKERGVQGQRSLAQETSRFKDKDRVRGRSKGKTEWQECTRGVLATMKSELVHVLVFRKRRRNVFHPPRWNAFTVPASKIREQIPLEKFTPFLIALMRVWARRPFRSRNSAGRVTFPNLQTNWWKPHFGT